MQENPFLFRGSWHHYFLRIIYQRGNIWKIELQLPRQQCSHSSQVNRDGSTGNGNDGTVFVVSPGCLA